jgi:hypothetical protein
MPTLISAEEAALAMVRGFERGEFEIHFPKRFTRWLKVLRLLPCRGHAWTVPGMGHEFPYGDLAAPRNADHPRRTIFALEPTAKWCTTATIGTPEKSSTASCF